MTESATLSPPMPSAARFLPFLSIQNWLDSKLADELLAYAIQNENRFKTSAVLYNGNRKIDHDIRYSSVLSNIGPFEEGLTTAALVVQPTLEKAFGVPAFTTGKIEIELAAHSDGAHFQRHIDTFVVLNKSPSPRVLTLVLYLNRRPRAFTGGAIRMYALNGTEVKDIDPEHNLLVAFPSFAPHSVERVNLPGSNFADRRFAINIWLHRAASII